MSGRFVAGRVRQLLLKEFRQLLRDPRAKSLLFIAPIMQLLIFGYAATTDVRNVATYVVELGGVTLVEPVAWTLPTSGSMDTSVAFWDAQLRVTDWPFSIVAGSAVKLIMGEAGAAGASGGGGGGAAATFFLWQGPRGMTKPRKISRNINLKRFFRMAISFRNWPNLATLNQ